MKISLKKAELESMELSAVLNFIREISANYQPVLYSIRKEYRKRLGLPEETNDKWWDEITSEKLEDEGIFGDIVLNKNKDILFYKIELYEKCIQIGFIGNNVTEDFDSFFKTISELADKYFDKKVVWTANEYDSEIKHVIDEQSCTCNPTEEENELSIILEDEKTRDFLMKIKDITSASITSIFPKDELSSLAPIVDMFEKRQVITKDFVVLCSKTGQPILKVSSKSALEETPQGANKCFICGNPLSKETIDEIVSCSSTGKKFIEHGYWLQVRIIHALEKAGIKSDQVRLWVSDNDITYMFSIINGQSFLFVLADNKVTIEDIYKIKLYVESYNIDNVLLISTKNIPLIIKKYIESSSTEDVSFNFIETLNSIDDTIELFIIERCSAYISKLLSSFITFTPVKINELVIESITNTIPTVQKAKKHDENKIDEIEEMPVEETTTKKGKKGKKPEMIELDI